MVSSPIALADPAKKLQPENPIPKPTIPYRAAQTQQWIDELLERVFKRKAGNFLDPGCDWSTQMSTFLVDKIEVPDFAFGMISHQNNACLPENGTADEIKDGIYAVMEESAGHIVRRVQAALTRYDITVLTSEVDLLGEHLTIHCLSDKPVMQINTIMSNKVMRAVMPSRARICVNTHVEENRRTDDYLKHKPARQEISREFFYENGSLVRDEPMHWSAGTNHEPGDILRIGSIAHRIEGERDDLRNRRIAYDGDPVAGRDDRRRFQAGTPFQPGERAYWNIARNR